MADESSSVMVRQLSFDFLDTQRMFSAMLPRGFRVIGAAMYGRAPVMWVLADWSIPEEKIWFLYTINNTPIALKHPQGGAPIAVNDLVHTAHVEQVDNTRFPPVVVWHVFQVLPRPEMVLENP